ncbi:pentatricopeptide repeat-containing protein At2g13600-like [Macadamia integrifolia]|uniref:pentatricopeptide repeat-containing protein At2g13600-like n=1 Tax=Macadamia integrifolia TaxID=60698 RepID=UPI001C528D3E|nr:pentatricopeptide repeat-containing protein At2g13600-like [Macadamia integrifolia]
MAALPASDIRHIFNPPLPHSCNDSNSRQNATNLSLQNSKPTNQSLDSPLSIKRNSLSFLHGPPDSCSYAPIIESCTCPHLGKQIHAHSIKNGFCGHEFLETKLLEMYGRCGCVEQARLLFEKMPLRNIYSWTAIITVFSVHCYLEECLSLFQELLFEGINLEFFIFPVLLKVCSALGTLKLGRQLHGFVIKSGFIMNIYVGNALIDMYGKCGSLGDAKEVLAMIPQRDIVSWNSIVTGCATNSLVFEALELLENMRLLDKLSPNLVSWSAVIAGFAQNGYDKEALELLHRMQAAGVKPNARTLASILPACARLQTLSLGKEIHGYTTRHGFLSNPFVINGLLDLYRRCSDMDSALTIFSKLSERNLISFNTMVVGYYENGEVDKAKKLFDQMELLGINRDITTWNSMVSGYVGNGMFDEALQMFRDMQTEELIESDSFTLGSILTVCADLASLKQGKEIHSYAILRGLQSNPFVGGALVEMYCKCNDLVAAQLVFDEVLEKDTATWNILISGYARCNQMEEVQELLQKMKIAGFDPNTYTWNGIIAGYVENGHNESALQAFSQMLHASDLRPDVYTVGIVLPACSRLASIERGQQVHAHAIRCGFDITVQIGAALVDMYAKCGCLKRAQLAFNRISKPNLVSWNAMLAGYAMHGKGKEGITLFREMLAYGIIPNAVTFLSVLSLCVHAGSLDQGKEYFDLMAHYNVEPSVKHYTCMVDLLSRAGWLSEAYELVKKMPVEADSVTWGALLGGCVIHRNVELGEIAANWLIKLEPHNAANYVLLANLYAYARRWDNLAHTRLIVKDRGMQKSPGCSWIEDRYQTHVFLACDRSHKRAEEIYSTLDNLTIQMGLEGYRTHVSGI